MSWLGQRVRQIETYLDGGQRRALFYGGLFVGFVFVVVVAALLFAVFDTPPTITRDQNANFWKFLFFFFLGAFVALYLGSFIVNIFRRESRLYLNVPPTRRGATGGALTGHFERLLAFGLVFSGVITEGIIFILIGWMGAKLALNWERPISYPNPTPEQERQHRAYGFTALMAGTLSLIIAALGGAIARCGLF